MKKQIPSTILFKLVAHSSTEDLIIVVVDWVDEPKPSPVIVISHLVAKIAVAPLDQTGLIITVGYLQRPSWNAGSKID